MSVPVFHHVDEAALTRGNHLYPWGGWEASEQGGF